MNRLSDMLHTAVDADGELDHLDLDALHARAGTRRRRRTQVRLVGGVVGALALVAGLSVAVGAGADAPGQVRAEAPSTSEPPPSSEPSTTEAGTTVPEPTTTTTTTSTAPTTSTTEPAPSGTTEPAPTTEPPPATTPPAPTVVELTWDYTGLEQYRLGQPECPEITHWIDGEATASDGSTWTLRTDYCGAHVGSQWTGRGTFTLTAASGETLTGTTYSTAPAGTDGIPHTYTVEGGTGPYQEAAGDCVVTTHITDKVFGSQHHEGTITCTVTLGAADGSIAGSSEGGGPESA